MSAVEVSGLTVRYGTKVAVDDVSFTAEAGTVTAVLGPNGAGKTSTIEVCEGYRRATRGTVRVLGLDPATRQRQLGERIGVMLQDGGVYPSARVLDTIRHYCVLHGRGADAAALLEQVGLHGQARSTWRRLSGGERQRLMLAMALAARPDVAFLDEPTSGVDINGRDTIRSIVRTLADGGCAVVLATPHSQHAQQVVPTAVDARLHHVGGEFVGSTVEGAQFGRRRHAPTVLGQPWSEDVRHQAQPGTVTDRARHRRRRTHVLSGADEFGVRITHLILTEPTALELVDEMTARETVIDHTCATERAHTERHGRAGYSSPERRCHPPTTHGERAHCAHEHLVRHPCRRRVRAASLRRPRRQEIGRAHV